MEYHSDKSTKRQRTDKQSNQSNMALSYMQEAQRTGLLAMKQDMPLAIKQEHHHHHLHAKHHRHHQASSPPLNNNNNNNNATSLSSAALYGSSQIAAAASLSMMTPQQFLTAAAELSVRTMLAARMTPELAQTMPFYSPHNMFSGWVPPSTSPPQSQTAQLPVGPASPALSAKSHRSTTSVNYNNNNVISSSSGGNATKKTASKRKIKVEANLASPTSSASPEFGKESNNGSSNNGRDKLFTCGICNRSFGYKHVLQNHERTHTGEKPFKCHTCGKSFTRDHHLKTHMRLHTGEKPYVCKHCDKRFVQVANLRRHLRVHTGEKPYICEFETCAKRYSDSNQLKSHMQEHQGEKPFCCKYCSATFARKQYLKSHKCSGGAMLTTMLPSSLVNTTLGGSTTSGSLGSPSFSCSDDLEHDNDDVAMMHDERALQPRSNSLLRQQQFSSPAMPLNLSGGIMTSDMPEQTEPEDLSMASRHSTPQQQQQRYQRPPSRSSGSDSPMSHSPVSDVIHEEDDDDERDVDEDLDVARASPSSLFVRTNLYEGDHEAR